MYWEYDEGHKTWRLKSNDALYAFVDYEYETYICWLLHTKHGSDAKFPTLAEAKAWCEAMCALEGKT